MENYREKLKMDNIILAIAAVTLALFCFLAAAGEAELIPFPVPAAGDEHWQSMWRGFISGATCAMLAFTIFGLAQNIRALKNEEALKKLHIKNNDERSIQVSLHALAGSMRACLLLGLVAVIVSGYFNMLVSITILGCIFFASIVGLVFKLYYNMKF